jgi:hypothetical protein
LALLAWASEFSPYFIAPELGRIVLYSLGMLGSLFALWEGCLLCWPIVFWTAVPHVLQADIMWWFYLQAWENFCCKDLPNLRMRFIQSFREAPQFDNSRKIWRRFNEMKLGTKLEVWSVSWQLWLPGEVRKKDGRWLHIDYYWPDGQRQEKWLTTDNEQLRSCYWGMLRRCGRRQMPMYVKREPAGEKKRPEPDLSKRESYVRSPRANGEHKNGHHTSGQNIDDSELQKHEPSALGPTANGQHMDDKAAASNIRDPTGGSGLITKTVDLATNEPRYRGYPMQDWCNGWWERHWWEKCAYDVVNTESAEEQVAEPSEHRDASSTARSREGMSSLDLHVLSLIEKHLHVGAASPSTSLAGANSLSFMALCRAVRADLHRELLPEVAIRCETVGELLQRVQEQNQLPKKENLSSKQTRNQGLCK